MNITNRVKKNMNFLFTKLEKKVKFLQSYNFVRLKNKNHINKKHTNLFLYIIYEFSNKKSI